ncbi:MAG TPA: flagellar hook protein FlgE [Polyangiaceae bacterium]|nr:flagellar hook protein FlgE [Polyangiaceae bacterium]
MSLQAMYSGVSGLQAETEALSTVGDNIANVNTNGFKSQRDVFEDVLGHSIMAGSQSAMPGSGVKVGAVQQMFTQGTVTNTGVSTDLALNGDGFFVVKGAVDGVSGNFYSRDGAFNINAQGSIVNADGLQLQGYMANADGTFSTNVTSLQVPTTALQPHASTSMTITANLDSSSVAPTAAFDPTNPGQTSNTSTSMTVYDSLGTAHSLNVYLTKTGDNQWDYHVLANGAEMNPATTGNVEVGTGSLTFNTSGALDTVTTTTPISVSFAGAKANQAISLNVGTAITGAGGTGLDGITQFSSPSNVSSQSQDGYASGDFSGVSVDSSGTVEGLYTNGQKLAIGQLTIAKFQNNEGLGRTGSNLWIDTRDSGPPALGTAGSGGRGAISAGSLEGSNVDLATEFVNLIQDQRSYSADSKTITTADQMLQELLQIKQ